MTILEAWIECNNGKIHYDSMERIKDNRRDIDETKARDTGTEDKLAEEIRTEEMRMR